MLYTQLSSRIALVLPAVSALIVAYIIEVVVPDGQTSCGINPALCGFQHHRGLVLHGLAVLRAFLVLQSTSEVAPELFSLAQWLFTSTAVARPMWSASGMRDPSTWPYSKGLQCQLLLGGLGDLSLALPQL